MRSPSRTLRWTCWLAITAVIGLGGLPALAAESAGSGSDAAAQPAGGSGTATIVPWVAVAASGPVDARPTAQPAQDWAPVSRGDELLPRTQIRTGRRGRATLTRQSSILIVDPESRLDLPAEEPGSGATSIIQSSGSILYKVRGQKNRGFRVVTPYLVAGVKGTVFLVSVFESYAAVTVDEGIVEVRSASTGEILEVEAGETLLVDVEEGAEMELISLNDRERKDGRAIRKESRKHARIEARRLERVSAAHDDLADAGTDSMFGDRSGVGGKEDPDDLLSDAEEEDKSPSFRNADDIDAQQEEMSEDQTHQKARTDPATTDPAQP